MLTHDDILSSLLFSFPEGQPGGGIALVSSFQNDDLHLPIGRARIFIPDCHLLTEADAKYYSKNHFQLKDQLECLLRGLTALKNNNRGAMTVCCLGDLFDFWRTRGNLGDKAEYDAITSEYSTIMELLFTSQGVRAELVAGNHDYAMHLNNEWPAKRFMITERRPREGQILILHGDVLDSVENLPVDIKKLGVKLATWVSAGEHELDQEDQEMMAARNRTMQHGNKVIGADKVQLKAADTYNVSDSFNVVDPVLAKPGNAQFYNEARELALALKSHGHDVRTVVIGHTHSARIVAGEREAGVPFALMDCGAWLGTCRIKTKGPLMQSAQIGVVVGSVMRIYQVGTQEVG